VGSCLDLLEASEDDGKGAQAAGVTFGIPSRVAREVALSLRDGCMASGTMYEVHRLDNFLSEPSAAIAKKDVSNFFSKIMSYTFYIKIENISNLNSCI
jgi:hypothetical protein